MKSTVNSAVMIQKTWRRYFAEIELKYSKRKFMISKEAAVNLQAFCRRWMAQKNFDIRLECATIIQKIWRGYKLKLQYNFDLSYIVFV